MTDFNRLRDEAADAYVKDKLRLTSLSNYFEVDLFKAGFDAATAHWLGQVKVLTEALEPFKRIADSREFSDPNNVWEFGIGGDKWRALKEALTKWAELTEGVNL